VAGTDSTQHHDETSLFGAPVVILVRPQLGENIGMCCRAMLNNGLQELRLVQPRDGWPSDKARAAASGADIVVDRVRSSKPPPRPSPTCIGFLPPQPAPGIPTSPS